MAREPYLPLFFGDLLASTATWEGEEQALYTLLLAYQWTAGPLPADPKRLARVTRYDPRNFLQLWQTVRQKYVETPDGLVNLRLEAHREKSKQIATKRSELGRAGGLAKALANPLAIATDLPEQNSAIQSNPIQSDLIHPNPESKKTRAARSPRPPPRKRCPEDFQITDDLRTWAKTRAPDVDVDRETERFRDWEFRTGRTDWSATWRTWMTRAQEGLASRPGRKATRVPKTADQLDAEWEAANAGH